MSRDKEYLGDGAYVANDGFSLILTTENGVSVQNEIYLEPDAVEALIRYHNRLQEARKVAANFLKP